MDAEYERRTAAHLQRIKRLRLFDDDFMTKCFENYPEGVTLLLRVILDRPDLEVLEFHVQHTIKNLQGRSLRLDILAVDSTGKHYNVEIQRDDKGADVWRARYHSSLIDANLLLPGGKTKNLPETFVIFITEHDIMGAGRAVYHVRRFIEETGRPFGDGSHILYVNGACRDETPVGRLMHDFSCTDPADMNFPVLAERVRYFKENKEGIQTMCQIWEEVRGEGLAEGREEGARNTLLASIKNLMETLHLTAEQAMEALRIPVEERGKFQSQI